ncbi:MAG: SGNH/GDSL hydrolase family protein [Candidatus Binatia bacterium]
MRRIVWMIVGSAAVLAVVAEIAAWRWSGRLPLRELVQLEPGDGRCVALKPGAHVEYTGFLRRIPAVGHDVNALGFRGRPIVEERSPSTLRIAVLGDSFTFGLGVGAEETIAVALEAALATKLDRRVEVLNFGVPGLNVEEVVEQYEHFASRWSPDVVLYLVVDNDLDRGLCGGAVRLLAGDGWGAALVRWSSAARLMYLLSVRSSVEAEGRRLALDPGAPDRFMAAVGRLESLVRAKGAQLGIVILGWPTTAVVGDRMSSAKLSVLDVSGILADPGHRIPDEGHLNAAGSRRVAEAIGQWIGK